ncbi:MAG: ABC transporter permease [Pyrinomonadaceae bacterium]|nr:ABC transporter permease [Phycisphaerales bacterium]
MIGSGTFDKLSRLQDTLVFKIVASIVVIALSATALSTYVVRQAAIKGMEVGVIDFAPQDTAPTPEEVDPAKAAAEAAEREISRTTTEADAQYYKDVLSARTDWTGVAVVVGEMTVLVLALIWLGLGLSGLGLLGLLTLIAWRLKLYRGQFVLLEELTRIDTALLFIGAVAVLTVSFLVLMQLLKLALSSSHPIAAVARNLVNEAVRLKISLVFIVLLIFMLAALPGLLDPGTPLRYRVQAFLSYGTSGTFWIIAILTVFLSVGSVSFEQRDRIIWQTMTKPVAAWQYILGKFLGIIGVAAVLLAVSSSGIFIFTDFLRRQKAVDESAPFISRGQELSNDRVILQTQVLTARITKKPEPPEINSVEFNKTLQLKVENFLKTNPTEVADLGKIQADLEEELRSNLQTEYFAIPPGHRQRYMFTGLEDARKNRWLSPERYAEKFGMTLDEVNQAMADNTVQSKVALTGGREILTVEVRSVVLRYKVQAGGNDPRTQIRLTFQLQNQSAPVVKIVSLNATAVLEIPPSAVDDNGNVFVDIANGDVIRNTVNPEAVVFPPDGLELRYSVGGYEMNFARVMIIQWLKLMFLAMAAITAATFLSFPVAAMMAFGVLFVAESAGFIHEALNYYDASVDGKFDIFRFVVRLIALPIASIFRFYADINPIEALADGKLVSWRGVIWTATIMLGTCAVLYGIGVGIFRKRELATYSGQ